MVSMADDLGREDVDRALETAVRRTADAQSHVGEVIDEGLVPPAPVVDDVVQRAEDVRDLAGDLKEPRRDGGARDGGATDPDRDRP
jgi:hypothetical protein